MAAHDSMSDLCIELTSDSEEDLRLRKLSWYRKVKMQASSDSTKEEKQMRDLVQKIRDMGNSKRYRSSHSMDNSSLAKLLLQKQLNEMYKLTEAGFSAGLLGLVDESDLFKWRVAIFGPLDTIYEGGFFEAIMSFPKDYPFSPPTVTFITDVWHPNVYSNGTVCIFPPRDDPNGCELVSECWTPAYTVESIFLCIISMLSSPNVESPANAEAAKMWGEQRDEFNKKALECVRRSQESFYSTTTDPNAMPTYVATSFQNFVDEKRKGAVMRTRAMLLARELLKSDETAFSGKILTIFGKHPTDDITLDHNVVNYAPAQQEKKSKQTAKE